jgi:hypothetical protein
VVEWWSGGVMGEWSGGGMEEWSDGVVEEWIQCNNIIKTYP